MRDSPASMRASSRSACDAAPVGRMPLKNGLQKKPVFSQPGSFAS
jgi:hypothetical protein